MKQSTDLTSENMTYGLSREIIDALRGVFARFSAIEQVLIFGSRAKNTFKACSDIDLAVQSATLSDDAFTQLWNEIDDLPIIFKIDLLHLDQLKNIPLKAKIQHEGCIFYP